MNEQSVRFRTGLLPAVLDGRTLKIIALVSMLIDHTGVALFPQLAWMRYVGRLAFPIYCYLLTEGALHTRDIRKYIFRLLVFAAVSELSFDLALMDGRLFYMKHQNVFFTLAIGVAMIWACEYLNRLYSPGKVWMLHVAVFAAAAMIAECAEVDYHSRGIMVIAAFYFFRNEAVLKYFFVALVLFNMGGKEPAAILSLILIDMYNGKRGSQPTALKYAFYAIYPVHLTILYLIARSGIIGG